MTDEEIEGRILEVEGLIRASASSYRQWADKEGNRYIRVTFYPGGGSLGLQRTISKLELKHARRPRLLYLDTLRSLFKDLHYYLHGGIEYVGGPL